jgi:hypothetical protein
MPGELKLVEKAKVLSSGRKIALVAGAGLIITGVLLSPLVWSCWFGGNSEEREMRALIARLAKAERHDARFADMIIYSPERDTAVRAEIQAKGRKVVPYLIEGLHHRNEDIRHECAILLSVIPTREGVEALITCLREQKRRIPYPESIQRALHTLTGYSKCPGPGESINPTLAELRDEWEPWWEANKDRLVETDDGLGIVQDDGRVRKVSLREQDASYYKVLE